MSVSGLPRIPPAWRAFYQGRYALPERFLEWMRVQYDTLDRLPPAPLPHPHVVIATYFNHRAVTEIDKAVRCYGSTWLSKHEPASRYFVTF